MPPTCPVSRDGRRLTFMRWGNDASNIWTYKLGSAVSPVRITHDGSPDPGVVNNAM